MEDGQRGGNSKSLSEGDSFIISFHLKVFLLKPPRELVPVAWMWPS